MVLQRNSIYITITASASGNDSVVVNWVSHNTNEALIAESLTGTRTTAPFFNSEIQSTNTDTSTNYTATRKARLTV